MENLPSSFQKGQRDVIKHNFKPDDMQTPNICVNAVTTVIMSFMNNFKLAEKCNTFRSLSIKYTKLTHYIEDKMSTDTDINGEDI